MFLSSSRRQDPDPPLVITYSSRAQTQFQTQQMRFPLLFAVPTDDARDRVSIFQATLLREGPDRWGDSPSVYLIAPYRIFHGHDDAQWPDEAFVRTRDGRAADERPNHDVLLVADYPSRPRYYGEEAATDALLTQREPERRAMYRGSWRHDAATVFSMYCSAAIPILRFISHSYLAPWPTARFNRLPLIRASPELVRAWVRRWDPASWTRDVVASSSDDEATPEPEPIPSLLPVPLPAPVPAVASQAVASQVAAVAAPLPQVATLPTFVAAALIADAVHRDLACPITMEPINPDTATVTPCYHVFDADALSAWVAQQLAAAGPATCPVCKVRI
jgi:hypothetical protein